MLVITNITYIRLLKGLLPIPDPGPGTGPGFGPIPSTEPHPDANADGGGPQPVHPTAVDADVTPKAAPSAEEVGGAQSPPVARPRPMQHRQPLRSPQNGHTQAQSSMYCPQGGQVAHPR
jgi:hypothetical protein